ncbi:glutathionylspermidine synthase family protein [Mariprofundus erugo]|uniref:Glutathionylspermidine synthase family protein n=1 Tax=Mariprofundus erugo TaxID=2528639 RepID=A0A5R9GN89_9PROT|nr:glutathionylspermidine synthase family protein [Mariprofundus erugo]TLS65737.1 glutathionylspermidine synthase family protein [Mariprofundus erugo]
MNRIHIEARSDWVAQVEGLGFKFHSIGGCYWNEAACYVFTEAEIDLLDDVTAELHQMCLSAVDHVVASGQYGRLAIPEWCHSRIEASWRSGEPSLYGRFDLCLDPTGTPRLLEYNADTPTSVYEASVIQWQWLKEQYPKHDQFNSIHEKLIERWRVVARGAPTFHFSSIGSCEEDFLTTEYLRGTAEQAGVATRYLPVEQVGWSESARCFVDMNDKPITHWFKLYPWEWLISDEFGRMLPESSINLVEPWWKMILSNKGILAILWELFPNHPNLIPSYFTSSRLANGYVRKPLLSREGANISMVHGKIITSSPGDYGKEGWVFQESVMLPEFDGNHAVIGSWIVGDQPAGIGIREDDTPITRDTSRFVPHYFI